MKNMVTVLLFIAIGLPTTTCPMKGNNQSLVPLSVVAAGIGGISIAATAYALYKHHHAQEQIGVLNAQQLEHAGALGVLKDEIVKLKTATPGQPDDSHYTKLKQEIEEAFNAHTADVHYLLEQKASREEHATLKTDLEDRIENHTTNITKVLQQVADIKTVQTLERRISDLSAEVVTFEDAYKKHTHPQPATVQELSVKVDELAQQYTDHVQHVPSLTAHKELKEQVLNHHTQVTVALEDIRQQLKNLRGRTSIPASPAHTHLNISPDPSQEESLDHVIIMALQEQKNAEEAQKTLAQEPLGITDLISHLIHSPKTEHAEEHTY